MALVTESSLLFYPNLADEPEDNGLLRITKLAGHLFHVPIAYAALFGSELTVVRRLGSGREHWSALKTFPLGRVVSQPMVWPNPSGKPTPGIEPGDLRFAAGAPLRSREGMELGLLVIADVRPRPDFLPEDLKCLAELAAMLARKLELQMMADVAHYTKPALREADLRNIANAAPVLMIDSSGDGASVFVNKTWLDFTGRTLDEEVFCDGFIENFHPDYRDAAMRKYWDAFQSRRPHTHELPMRRHDGVYRWMRVQGVPRFRSDGVFAGYLGCFVDITEERLAREEIEKQRLASATLAVAAGVSYLILDRDGTIEHLGPGVTADLRQCPFWEVSGTGSSEVLCQAFGRAVASLQATETKVVCSFPTGKSVERRWTFTPVWCEQPKSLAVVATVEVK
jgi:PAS domain S-box-containing protein